MKKTSEIFIKCFFELFLKTGYTVLSRRKEQGFHAHSRCIGIWIQGLQETFENILGTGSYQRYRDEMVKQFNTSNSAENPIFSPNDYNSSGRYQVYDAQLEPYGGPPYSLRKYYKIREVCEKKTSEIFIKCFFELFLKTG